MGLFDFLKNAKSNNQPKSKYEHLPLIDVEADKRTPKGYVERKFLDEEKIYQQCDNVFYQSNIPIVNQCQYATRYIETMVLLDPSGKKMRSVTEIIYYSISETLKTDYLQLIAQLNNLIIKYELPSKYIISLDKIEFVPSGNGYTQIPLSYIQHNQEKHEFYFKFSNQIKSKARYKHGSSIYEATEIGSITFTEDGNLKKAEFTKIIKNKKASIKFKNYKTGFDLYEVKYNNEVIYKRNTNNKT